MGHGEFPVLFLCICIIYSCQQNSKGFVNIIHSPVFFLRLFSVWVNLSVLIQGFLSPCRRGAAGVPELGDLTIRGQGWHQGALVFRLCSEVMLGYCRNCGQVSGCVPVSLQSWWIFQGCDQSLGVFIWSTAHIGVSFFGQGGDEVPGPGEGESVCLVVTGRGQLLFDKHVTKQHRRFTGRHHSLLGIWRTTENKHLSNGLHLTTKVLVWCSNTSES